MIIIAYLALNGRVEIPDPMTFHIMGPEYMYTVLAHRYMAKYSTEREIRVTISVCLKVHSPSWESGLSNMAGS